MPELSFAPRHASSALTGRAAAARNVTPASVNAALRALLSRFRARGPAPVTLEALPAGPAHRERPADPGLRARAATQAEALKALRLYASEDWARALAAAALEGRAEALGATLPDFLVARDIAASAAFESAASAGFDGAAVAGVRGRVRHG
jgi:hypothetical protein